MSLLQQYVAELESKINKLEQLNPEVSKSDIGWHIEHCLLIINVITESLKKSNVFEYKKQFNLSKFIVYSTKKIPRGKAKAPKIVAPITYSKESLVQHIAVTKNSIKELGEINPGFYFNHPIFGHLKLKETISFLEIHTKHHLKIIVDIEK